jgi:hypothetical protein
VQTSAFAHYPVAVQYSYEIILASVENVKENIGRRKNSRLP